MTAKEHKRQPISTGSEWTFELIQAYDREISRIAAGYALDTYPNQIEVITAEQMMDAYASVGMPLGYHHWSYGKHFLSTEKSYSRGQMGLAYEIVINSDPCIAYLMEENTICMQALVVAHACYGHNSFFKGNYLFRTWTDASSIIDYLVFAKQYIMQCEERHGIDAVEDLLDSCHALMNYGVDRYKRPYPISAEEERRRQKDREEHLQKQINDLWRTIPKGADKYSDKDNARFPAEPQENILYFIEKHAPLLEPWQREIVRIVRKIAQYFYPQRQTQVMNEGWATFWHHRLINDMYDAGQIDQGILLECLHSHTNVIRQPEYARMNPYALGFAAWNEIKRVCEAPTAEDREHLPDIAGKDWLETFHNVMQNYRDESFLLQFLTPKLVRDFRLMAIQSHEGLDHWTVSDTAGSDGFKSIRSQLAAGYRLEAAMPEISVVRYGRDTDRKLVL